MPSKVHSLLCLLLSTIFANKVSATSHNIEIQKINYNDISSQTTNSNTGEMHHLSFDHNKSVLNRTISSIVTVESSEDDLGVVVDDSSDGNDIALQNFIDDPQLRQHISKKYIFCASTFFGAAGGLVGIALSLAFDTNTVASGSVGSILCTLVTSITLIKKRQRYLNNL